MKKRSLIALLMALAMILGIVGCGKTSGGEEAGASEDYEYLIGVLPYSLTEETALQYIDGIKEVAEANNCKVVVTDCKGDGTTQVKAIEDFITMGVDAILMQPVDTESAASAAQEAKDGGIVVITYDNIISMDYDATFLPDSTGGGAMSAEALAEAMGYEGCAFIFTVPPFVTSGVKVYTAQMETIDKYEGMERVDEVCDVVTREEIMSIVENVIQANGGKVGGMLGTFAEATMAELAACEAQEESQVKIVSYEAPDEVLHAVADGTQVVAAVDFQPVLTGNLAMEGALKILAGETIERENITPCLLVTPEIAKERLGQ